jgi:peroxiredoxin
MPVFDAAARRLSGKVIFLAVDYDEDEQTVKNFVADNHLALPILLDPGGKVVDQYYVRSFPTTFFIDAEGIVRAQHIGGMNEQELANYLERTGFQP